MPGSVGFGEGTEQPSLGDLLGVCSPRRRKGMALLGQGLCWDSPFSAEGQTLGIKRLNTNDDKGSNTSSHCGRGKGVGEGTQSGNPKEKRNR